MAWSPDLVAFTDHVGACLPRPLLADGDDIIAAVTLFGAELSPVERA